MLNKNNKPTELQRYKKNTKQKKILIGTILLFILIIGGIKLYRTFALYKEEKSFNVLKGIVPDFHTYYKESILNGAYPELKGNLIPVTIDDKGTVRKADIDKKWYSYEEQEWANAIIKQNSYDVLDAYGKVNGATKEKGYVSFDGVDDYIDLGLENYDFGSTVSLAIRLSFNKLDLNFFGNWENGGGGFYFTNNMISFNLYNEKSNTYIEYRTNIKPELNKTYTLIGTYDGKEMKLYINGKYTPPTTFDGKVDGEIRPSSMPFTIGANPDLNEYNKFSDINVYQAAIFDRALTKEEIESDFSIEIKIHDNTELLKYVDFTEREEAAEEIIPEDIIESYFVWIPKYRYKIFDMGEYNQREITEYKSNEKPIEIKFGLTNTIDDEEECIAPPSGENGTCAVNKWMTHPAFTAFDTKGIWVGKFETGYKGATNKSDAQQDKIETDRIIIKPNEYSWRIYSVENIYQNSLNYNKDLNSHMMKNTEWGAVAYLTQSIYGRCPNNKCSEIRINNNSTFLTGYAAKMEPTIGYTNTNESCTVHPDACNEYGTSEKGQDGDVNYQYFNPKSVTASTTNNYTGIYDMSGGTWETVIGIMNNENDEIAFFKNSSNSNTLIDEKYYDAYKYSNNGHLYSNRILGDATGEMGLFRQITYIDRDRTIGNWYKDYGLFFYKERYFLERGGHHGDGTDGGIFTFEPRTENNFSDAFRITLAF